MGGLPRDLGLVWADRLARVGHLGPVRRHSPGPRCAACPPGRASPASCSPRLTAVGRCPGPPHAAGAAPVPFLAADVAQRRSRQGRWPRWWLLLPAVVLYANVHGLWVMVPAMLGLAVVGRWLDHGLRDRAARQGLVLAVSATAAGAISPLGLANITAVVPFRDATELIIEWRPTDVTVHPPGPARLSPGWPSSRGPEGPRPAPCAQRGARCARAWWRSPSPRCETCSRRRFCSRRSSPAGAAEAWDVHALSTGRARGPGADRRIGRDSARQRLGGCGDLVDGGSPAGDPARSGSPQRLDARAEPIRLFNELQRVRGGARVRRPGLVGIDGRADYYGGDYIADYVAVIQASPARSSRFLAADPDAALPDKRCPAHRRAEGQRLDGHGP